MKLFFATLLLLGFLPAMAATKASVIQGDFPWMTEAQVKKAKSEAQARNRRAIANGGEVNDQFTSQQFKAVRIKFLAASTPQELEAVISEMNASYNSYPQDLKLVAALLTPLLQFRAFTYKMYPFFSKKKLTHSFVVSRVQGFASYLRMNLPTAQWKAGFDYVTHPSNEDDLKRFETTGELQDYLSTKVYPAYRNAIIRINALNFSNERVVWDNRFFYGTASFSSDFNRYQLLGEGERHALLSVLHFAVSDMAKFTAYNMESILSLMSDMAALYGYDGFFSDVDGVSARKVKTVFEKPAYRDIFTLRSSANLDFAFKHLKEGAHEYAIAWNELKDRNDDRMMIRAAIFTPFIPRISGQAEEIEAMVSGRTIVRSNITGETATVDLPGFYASHPQDLKTLLPTGFDQSAQNLSYAVAMKNGKQTQVPFRNYYSGRATQWSIQAYKGIFPDTKLAGEPALFTRVLNESSAGMLALSIVQPFMMY
jgi:hypothetical protein